MAEFFATLKHSDFIISTVLNRTGELIRIDSPGSVLIAWGDMATCTDMTAVMHALKQGRDPSLWGRSAILFDKSNGHIVAASDMLGLYPISLFSNGNEIGAASSSAAIVKHRPHLAARGDGEAVVELLGLGQLLGERTLFPAVYHCRPGTVVRLENGCLPLTVSQTLPSLENGRCSRNRALDALVAAVDHCLRFSPDALIPLSGGLDSRLLLACAMASGHQPDTFSYGARASSDRHIANTLAGTAQCWHFEIDLEARRIAHEAPQVGPAGAGEVGVNHAHGLLAAATMPELDGRPLITGTGSETFRCFYYDRGAPGLELIGSPLLRNRVRPRALRYVVEHMSGGRLEALAGSGMELGRNALDRLEKEVMNLLEQTDSAAAGLDLAYLRMRVPRFVVAGQQLLDTVHPRYHPFLNRHVVEAMSGLSVGQRMGGKFHRWAIRKLAPQLAAVDWDKTGRPLAQGLTLTERWPGLAARFGAVSIYGKAGAPVADYGPWARAENVGELSGKVAEWSGLVEADQEKFATWTASMDRVRAAGALSAIATVGAVSSRKCLEAA